MLSAVGVQLEVGSQWRQRDPWRVSEVRLTVVLCRNWAGRVNVATVTGQVNIFRVNEYDVTELHSGHAVDVDVAICVVARHCLSCQR